MTWEISPQTQKDTKTKIMRRIKKSEKQNEMTQYTDNIMPKEEKKAN